MVRKIKKVKRRKRPEPGASPWLVPFDAEGMAGIFIHKHGDTDDHSSCGPVVLCCERAVAPYKALAPDLVAGVQSWQAQRADHLVGWFENGLQAMYFVLCDEHDPEVVYQFGLQRDAATDLLMRRVGLNAYRLPERRFSAP